jgi:hypothetical protein
MPTPLIGAIATTLALLAAGPKEGVELRLRPLKDAYRSGEPVIVEVSVRNARDSKNVPYLKRGFWLVPYSTPMDGALALSLHVTDPKGRQLEPTRAFMMVVRTETHPLMFQPLHPGHLFGEELALNGTGLEFQMNAPGTYKVWAMLTASAPRKWFDGWKGTASDRREVEFKREHLFEGPLIAPQVELRIVEDQP